MKNIIIKMYLYIRINHFFNSLNIVKFGSTCDIKAREDNYITTEPYRGEFIKVYKLYSNNYLEIENKIHEYLRNNNYHFYHDGGQEFYKNEIINIFSEILQNLNINFIELSKDEINKLKRNERIRKNDIKPYYFQKEIINSSLKYFKKFDKGILNLPCGFGKTIISLFIIKELNFNKILILVPNILLVEQWKKEIELIFNNYPIFSVNNNLNNLNKFIVVSTYHSCNKFVDINFDFKIYDECHHLSGNKKEDWKEKEFKKSFDIKSKFQLGLTATLKISDDEKLIGNNTIEYFGKVIESRTLNYAIENNIISNYQVYVIESNFNIQVENNLQYSALCAIESINTNISNHILICCNKIENTRKIKEYLDLYNKNNSIYISEFNSEMTKTKREKIINDFTNNKQGIIISVYCLGEGWDLPILDTVIFAENMESNIRIIQTALRCCRKKDNKIGKLILPILNINNLEDESPNFKNVKEVLLELSNSDENLFDKVKFFTCNFNEPNDKKFIEIKNEKFEDFKIKTIEKRKYYSFIEAKKLLESHNIEIYNDYDLIVKNNKRFPLNPKKYYNKNYINFFDYIGSKIEILSLEKLKQLIDNFNKNNQDFIKSNFKLNYNSITKKFLNEHKNVPHTSFWKELYDGFSFENQFKLNSHFKF